MAPLLDWALGPLPRKFGTGRENYLKWFLAVFLHTHRYRIVPGSKSNRENVSEINETTNTKIKKPPYILVTGRVTRKRFLKIFICLLLKMLGLLNWFVEIMNLFSIARIATKSITFLNKEFLTVNGCLRSLLSTHTTRHNVVSFDKTLYDAYLCLVKSKQQIKEETRFKAKTETLKQET